MHKAEVRSIDWHLAPKMICDDFNVDFIRNELSVLISRVISGRIKKDEEAAEDLRSFISVLTQLDVE